MKAAILKAKKQPLTIEQLPDPTPGAGEVVVQVLTVPILAYTHEVFSGERDYPLLLPLAPGVGAIGLIEKTGPDATRLVPGQLVFCDPTVRSRDDVLSPDIMLQGWIAPTAGAQKLQSHFRHGSFAERMLLPMENAYSLEQLRSFDPAKLAWINTMLVPYGGLLAADLQPGQTILVNGATGHFGSAGIAVALAMGAARVIAPGRNEQMLNTLVSTFGPRVRPVLISEQEEDLSKRFRETADGPIDCLLDILGPMRSTTLTRSGIMALRPGGTAVLMGGIDMPVEIPYKYMMRNNLVVRGQYMLPKHAPLLLAALIGSGQINLEPFSVQTFPLEQANQAVEYARDHGGPFQLTVLTPTQR
ncbi:quinone oxidoreductase family protein [Dictyobacter aurantiacus]|uniref:Alcohol dehydrogenase n=1 Tax=Dictyobacter aurantiacus TaxID=1936993 RepID=A0A401ZRN9_9CHLR|nr:zinc-binding alcohol dehydrogenase family protein [Dictyobacter aurantiacus]GCE09588.1 alcohol dehydrogenase [Dictyobacter aurantiacus]